MNEYYVVLSEWCVDYESGHCVIGVYTSKEDAVRALNNRLDSEDRCLAEELGYTIYEDTDVCFDAGEDGEYVCDHIRVWVEHVKQRFCNLF